jgi:uncharacterized Tic20 family protein
MRATYRVATAAGSREGCVDNEIEQNSEARTFGMLCHLSGLFLGFVGPLLFWLIKREQYPFVDDQGKEALNFHITTR